jgi:hypothetical protein
MLYIHYNQTKPNETEFEYAIQGDNNVDVVDFDISDIQLDFEPAHIYAKVQSKDKKYTDKIELTANNSHLLWNLQAKTTRHKIVNVQLSFETEEQCFQTEMVELTLKPHIDADGTIENDYPTVLQDLQDQIDELKGQGGGGASSVEIEKVWLSYSFSEENHELVVANTIFGNNDQYNRGDKIFVNFKTTPINAQMEQEIKNGRFVIRLDYPIGRKRSRVHRNSRGNENYIRFEFDEHLKGFPTTESGMGIRSYTHNFFQKYDGEYSEIKSAPYLKKALIFVNESDIKTNDYGEKYIHKVLTFKEYMEKIFTFFDDNDEYNLEIPTQEDIIDLGESVVGDLGYRGSTGTPTITTAIDNFTTTRPAKQIHATDASILMIDQSGTNSVGSRKLNPNFTIFAPLVIKEHLNEFKMVSPYFVSRYNKRYYRFMEIESKCFALYAVNDTTTRPCGRKKYRAYTNAQPRCCIIDENYETKTDGSIWLKKYPACSQRITANCRWAWSDTRGYIYPIFRIIISKK